MGDEDDDTLTSGKAAKLLGVTARTIGRWADAGHLPHWKTPSGQRRFSRKELTRWLASRQNTTIG